MENLYEFRGRYCQRPVLEFPVNLDQLIVEQGGINREFLMAKRLESTDFCVQNRLFFKYIRTTKWNAILTPAEKQIVWSIDGNGLAVTGVDENGANFDFLIRRWWNKDEQVVLRGEWLRYAQAKSLEPDDVVELWKFRVDGVLLMAILFKKYNYQVNPDHGPIFAEGGPAEGGQVEGGPAEGGQVEGGPAEVGPVEVGPPMAEAVPPRAAEVGPTMAEGGGPGEIATVDDPEPSVTMPQEDCLLKLKTRLAIDYDNLNPEHQDTLWALCYEPFPPEEKSNHPNEQLKKMGWQGEDPSTDFRVGKFMTLENLLYFARNFPKSFHNLLQKQEGDQSMWEYPFAVVGVNITSMLIQMLDLEAESAVQPRKEVGTTFMKLLAANEFAFDVLYCVAFEIMDQQWLAMGGSYMDFKAVMKSTRHQLEEELLLNDIARVEELPSYSLLSR